MTQRPENLPDVPVDAASAANLPAEAGSAPLDLAGALVQKCISTLNDTLLITEAVPFDEPGPRIVFVNEAFQRQTGYTPAEVLGRSPRFLQGPKTDRAELSRIRAALGRWEEVRAELVNYKKNGEEFFVEMDIVPVADASGRYTHWVSVQRDVTARKRAEAQAKTLEMQRIESLGRLSIGIAHDFNNIVAAILGNAAIGWQAIEAGRIPRDSLEQINTAALRARSLVQRILAYGRRQPQAFRPELLGPIVVEASDLLRPTLTAGVAFNVAVAGEPLWALADASQIYQVLLNLCTNAAHAMQGASGSIEIVLDAAAAEANAPEADDAEAQADAAAGCDAAVIDGTGPPARAAVIDATGPPASTSSTPRLPRFARLRVRDTGSGMDASTRARIFEPYFTTKGMGLGTGLGLSVVSDIVAAHGGTISVASEPGRGSEFVLLFPLVEPAPVPVRETVSATAALPAVEALRATLGNGEHVMVVDDDEVVVPMIERMLINWGFRVTACDDPQRAVELVEAGPLAYDAVVTDMNMPSLSGLQLAREVAGVRHDLPVLIGSGYVDDALTEAASRAGVAAVFCKEFAAETLGTLLQEALARPPAGGR